MNTDPNWLRWARELHAIAQIGLTYAEENSFDQIRYERIMEISAEIMTNAGEVDAPTILDLYDKERPHGYLTPKVDVRAFVFDAQERILLVREVADGCWSPPGGWADVNESASSVAARECWEEAGVEVRPIKLIALLDRSEQGHTPPFPFHVYKAYFLCQMVDANATPRGSNETSDVGFFAENNLPPLSLGRILPSQIEMAFGHLRNRELPTEYD